MSATVAPDAASSPTKAHLDAVDVARVLTVALVIAVHVVSQQPGGIGLVNGAALIVMHVSRQVFFLLTTFVLVYSYRDRPPARWSMFWRRRYLLVGVPYLVWSAVYLLANGQHLWPLGPALRTFALDVAEGTARYHLYFLLVTMQVYLVFPLLLRLWYGTCRRHGWLLAGAVVYQLGVYGAVAYRVPAGFLKGWLNNPSPFLPSYLGVVIIGGIAACHADGFLAWTRVRARWVYAGCALAVAAGVAVFLIQVLAYRQPAWAASSVFQPVVVIESLAVAWTYLALGLAWQHRGTPARRWVRAAADASFGVYLAHPLLLQSLLALGAATGLSTLGARAPGGLVTAVSMVIVVPLIYLTCAVFAELARRTPLSLPLTGRSRRRVPEPRPCPPQAPDGQPVPAPTTVVGASGGAREPVRAAGGGGRGVKGQSGARKGGRRRRRRTRKAAARARRRRRALATGRRVPSRSDCSACSAWSTPAVPGWLAAPPRWVPSRRRCSCAASSRTRMWRERPSTFRTKGKHRDLRDRQPDRLHR